MRGVWPGTASALNKNNRDLGKGASVLAFCLFLVSFGISFGREGQGACEEGESARVMNGASSGLCLFLLWGPPRSRRRGFVLIRLFLWPCADCSLPGRVVDSVCLQHARRGRLTRSTLTSEYGPFVFVCCLAGSRLLAFVDWGGRVPRRMGTICAMLAEGHGWMRLL